MPFEIICTDCGSTDFDLMCEDAFECLECGNIVDFDIFDGDF